jgi:SAM-dependent methyltransferase
MSQAIDVEQIMRQIRERIRKRGAGQDEPPAGGVAEVLDWISLERSAQTLQRAASQLGRLPPQPPGLRAWVGALLVKVVRRALFWYTPEIIQFQESAARAITDHMVALKSLAAAGQRTQAQLRNLLRRLDEWSSEMERIERELDTRAAIASLTESLRAEAEAREQLAGRLDAETGQGRQHLSQLRTTVMDHDRRSSLIAEEARQHLSRLRTTVMDHDRRLSLIAEEARQYFPSAFPVENGQAFDEMYFAFENRFRGSRGEIKERFQVYLPYLQQNRIGTEEMPVLDLGCGRGEWLELLGEQHLRAQGIDKNRAALAQCRDLGLNVTEADILPYLHLLPGQSLGGVTGFHIIEHLPIEALLGLFAEAARVLKPGGLAIFETPNPQNVLVGAHNFYLDFTHRNPLPSLTVQFLLEARGFHDVKVLPLHPYPESLRLPDDGSEIAKRFNEYFYGPQDYAVIGRV